MTYRHPEAKIRSTPALRRGDLSIWMCSWCGLMVSHRGDKPPEGDCPDKHADQGWWWGQVSPTGPFYFDTDLVHSLADLVGLTAAEAFEVLMENRLSWVWAPEPFDVWYGPYDDPGPELERLQAMYPPGTVCLEIVPDSKMIRRKITIKEQEEESDDET